MRHETFTPTQFPVARTPAAKILLEAITYLEIFGWCQNLAYYGPKRCAGAALDPDCKATQPERTQAIWALMEANGGEIIPTWNDEPGRTFEEIRSTFYRAIEIANNEN